MTIASGDTFRTMGPGTPECPVPCTHNKERMWSDLLSRVLTGGWKAHSA
eukprot:CAMPEP_0175985994 /NCGR_PEP_ID=MMETSP0108-20121206/49897_1 /TAXON_ID=195067 ORGANISM="Goniomonas pacifica, Strain CCMP1869" /NCGR_SAMPLE_ID=MMETSP0108 /ASSEMBLY_ACC=CAM_ASM_000204 /LENGTH=48 /DNA_ID= /DNA_START= /DNA_END= /DNA_ORIENTATION=